MKNILLVIALFALPALSAGEPLAPLDPSDWTVDRAAHLLRRAGFGGTPEEVAALHAKGLEGAVESLLDFEGKPDAGMPPLEITVTEKPGRELLADKSEEERQAIVQDHRRRDARQLLEVREWWMRTMIRTEHPLRERLTLFWHGHFTSGFRDVRDSYHMYMQNTLLRRHAAGNFANLLHDVSRDPAMLEYLDNRSNRKEHPNENYAREVMELFTLGAGNYTEEDIKEAARAFTGWTFYGNRFVFDRRQHDDGAKSFLGRKGRFDGDDVLDIILEQPATARTVATKLFRAFAHDAPSPELQDALGATLRRAKYDLRPLLRAILLSREFYSDASVGARIKGPVEFVVGLYRSLALEPPPTPVLANVAASLGQSLMDPPNVKGWDGGRDWINTSTLLARYNAAAAIVGLPEDRARLRAGPGRGGPGAKALDGKQRKRAEGSDDAMEGGSEMEGAGTERMPENEEARAFEGLRRRADAGAGTYDVVAEARRRGLETGAAVVDHFGARLLATPPQPPMHAALLECVGGEGPLDLAAPGTRERLHSLLRMIVSTPEFQLR